jgi:hypothetical protein
MTLETEQAVAQVMTFFTAFAAVVLAGIFALMC